MGGIVGTVVERDGGSPGAAGSAPVTVEALLDAMPWRGPGGRGVVQGSGGGIGHLLLAEDGLPANHPPVANEDGSR